MNGWLVLGIWVAYGLLTIAVVGVIETRQDNR